MQSPSDGGSNNPPHAPTNDAPGPSPQSQWPRWVHVVFFTFVVHLVMDLWCTCGLWWTCKLIWMDLSTYYYILWWMCYGRMDVWMDEIYMWWMRYICDGWDIYVMDKIYMWYMFVWMYLSWWNAKKKLFAVLGHFAECCTRQRTPLPSAMVTTLGKAGKMGDQKTDFPALSSAVTITLGKEIKKKY